MADRPVTPAAPSADAAYDTLCLIALTLCAYGDVSYSRAGDEIPQAVWDRLTEVGHVEHRRDHTGEGMTLCTAEGRDYLVATVAFLARAEADRG